MDEHIEAKMVSFAFLSYMIGKKLVRIHEDGTSIDFWFDDGEVEPKEMKGIFKLQVISANNYDLQRVSSVDDDGK